MENRIENRQTICLAGQTVTMLTRYPEAATCFKPYEVSSIGNEKALFVSNEEWLFLKKLGIEENGQNEASILTALASDLLLEQNRCIIHGVAVKHHGRAWIITGDSGVGKTTQARILMKIQPKQFSIICGDRPILEITETGVMVFPSPWNGKENLRGATAAPLAGILCLRRGETNAVQEMTLREAVLPVFRALIQTGREEGSIMKAVAFTEKLLLRCKVWEQVSATIPDSGELLYRQIFQEVDDEV